MVEDGRPAQAHDAALRDAEQFWREAIPEREPALRRGFLPAVALCIALSVPWYWPGPHAPVWLGLPAWVWVTIASSALVSALTAHAALGHWRDGE